MINNSLKRDLEYTYEKLSKEEKNKLSNSTILITGAAGFLGFYYVHFFYYYRKELSLKKVICLDNFMLGKPKWLDKISEDECFKVEKFDIINDNIADISCAEEVDYVIHMASIASPIFYRQYPIETLDANIWGLRHLLDYYSSRNIKGFLFYSSSEIYGNPAADAVPTDEEYHGDVSCTGPRACYDESKRFGETICMLFAKKYGMPIGVARPFNNYGPGMKINDKRVPADFANDILNDRDIVILSNGSPKRTFCYIADAIAGYLKIMLYGKYDYFNIGIDKPEISILELAGIYQKAGKEIFGYTGSIKYSTSEDEEYLTNNPQRRCPRIDKAASLLEYQPEISVHEGVRRFLEFIKESEKENLVW
ncbi:NAD-dependent epimerase/dehydratase family protein [Veillonellaceae bacterium WCA-693-APC-5D-A]|uniref:NAD-dependent epimerase/dehydratase family protein n=1 Tax=Anaerovibrio slackiae TaxID=2652309 RepID=A0A6I2UHV0_9FIRM|nr:NAD-dependent epimerase/dehydratase family protein [Anaerovibrio slackiae]MSU08582.1 NAD-dependent epimerase/dehydratase family protein [Anaerovibrio slackiae]